MPLDGYEQSENVWIDSSGNQLTYFNWGPGQPNNYNGAKQDYLEILKEMFNDEAASTVRNVICVKCSSYYSIPSNYQCIDTDFGTVVVKAYNQRYSHTAARDQCSSDANYLHLPVPKSATENQWYYTYSQHVGLSHNWLGITDVAVEGRDLQRIKCPICF